MDQRLAEPIWALRKSNEWRHGTFSGIKTARADGRATSRTAYASCGRVWVTIRRGILTEVYYPTIGDYIDIRSTDCEARVEFTLFWTKRGEWDSRN